MSETEQLSLSWDTHRKSICGGLSHLQQRGEFVDLTIAADGHHVKVHQLVMSLVSPYIKDLLLSVQCRHPVIFLNNISYTTLCALLEYIYTGEVLVPKNKLGDLIAAGKALHIKGLGEMADETTINQIDQTTSTNKCISENLREHRENEKTGQTKPDHPGPVPVCKKIEELTTLLNRSYTDETDNGERSQTNTLSSQMTDYNRIAQILLSSEKLCEDPQPSNPIIRAHINCQTYDVTPEGLGTENAEPSMPQVHVNDKNMNQLDNNKLYPILVLITQNQDKIMKNLGDISCQLSEINDNRTPIVSTLAEPKGFQTKKFTMELIRKVEDLEKLDKQLSNPKIYNNLLEKYSMLCSVASGSGTNCAYRLLDALFAKEFLCKCSWTGGSRGSGVKIGFKGYKNILNFFFEMIRYWDCTYTIQNNEHFFKTVLRNALKRKDSKNMRTSSKKRKRTLNINFIGKVNTNSCSEENTINDGEDNIKTNSENNTNISTT